ncbi:MAG: [FeFe] hydrogenase H-cluster maturation GTPase HydF [Monoglobales bacterium]
MSLNTTPIADRIHIGIFGKRNSGKSSLVNAITGQNLAIVSDFAGTTTDPVYKNMELLPLGPVVIIDTAGLDDEGELGSLRVEKTYGVLNKTNIAIVCVDIKSGVGELEKELIAEIERKNIPFVVVRNKLDNADETVQPQFPHDICVSAKTGENIEDLKNLLGTFVGKEPGKRLVGDLVGEGDLVILVIPIDSAAPKGRLILPQQQTIRDLLESGAIAASVRETELKTAIEKLGKPKLVITDSQAFKMVSEIVPEDVPLTSFSILFSRYKGEIWEMAKAAAMIDTLSDGDRILIAEGCTHHRQCDDIGTVKLPKWIREKTGKNIEFEFVSGGDFPRNFDKYKLVVHCGGCTLPETEVKSRIEAAKKANIPITNYGTLIAHINGILERSIKPLRKD